MRGVVAGDGDRVLGHDLVARPQDAEDHLVGAIRGHGAGSVEIRDLRSFGEKLSVEEIHSLFHSLTAVYEEIARSAFPRIVLDMALVRVARRRPILSVDEVVQRLVAGFGGLAPHRFQIDPAVR